MRRFRCLLGISLLCIVGMATTVAFAQDNDASQSAPAEHRGRGQFDPTKRTEMLTQRLGLSSDQQSKVLETLKSEQSQMEALRSDSSLSREDRRAKMMDIRKSANDQVRAILNPDQQKKWDEMQARREQWQGSRGGQTPPTSESPNQNQ